jgi:hypothetical protein
LLSNIAAEYEQDDKPVEALTYYCRYLTRDPDGINAPYAVSHARLLHARLINAQLEPKRGNEPERVDEICASYTAKPHHDVEPPFTNGLARARARHFERWQDEPPK